MLVTAQIICDIIKTGMELQTDQIWIYNQRRSIPEDDRLYITVGVIGIKPYGNNNRQQYNTTASQYQDTISAYMQETISIDLYSYTTEAIERYAECIGCLSSSYSQNLQNTHKLKIATVPISVNDVSHLEGPAQIYRISIALPVLRFYEKVIGADYYDQFYPAYVSNIEK